MQVESNDDDSDTKIYTTTNTNIHEGGNGGNAQVADTDVETVDIPGDDVPKLFVSWSYEEVITSKLFDISALPEETSIYYISPEETKLFYLK